MVKVIGPLEFHEEINVQRLILSGRSFTNNKYRQHSFKRKHTLKPKCKKFYKYKLRKNGEEDPDVIDVSHILLSTLRIKSPSKLPKNPEIIIDREELRPKNYLFKMAKRKPKAKTTAPQVVPNVNDVEKQIFAETESLVKKQTNAFQLLMESRNKSMGTNSPGKEKNIDQTELQDIIEKKNLKVKRNLALQKMSEAKGSLKRKELENYKDACIEKQMKKRAETLKNMIKPKDRKMSEESKLSLNNVKVVEIDDDSNSEDINTKTSKIDNKKPRTLQIVDMFIKPDCISPEKKVLSKEDKKFLSKLSPSIKKKENMLCYFKKINKESPTPDAEDSVEDSPVLKVKLNYKKKLKKKRLSLHEAPLSLDVLKDLNENNSDNNNTEIQAHISDNPESQELQKKSSNERKKRKRKDNLNVDVEVCKEETNIVEPSTEENGRPKRNVRKPVKYVDDLKLSSSDEELHIFTPRKKKRSDDKTSKFTKEKTEEILISDDESKKKASIKSKKNLGKEEKVLKKPAKLAPIFAPKPQLSTEQLEAKQKFLYSGVPDQIKKIVSQQKNVAMDITNNFTVVVHVQQKEVSFKTSTEIHCVSPDYNDNDDHTNTNHKDEHISEYTNSLNTFSKLITLTEPENSTNNMPSQKNNVTAVLQSIKEHYPKFPVHRSFRLLKTKSKGEFKEIITPDLDNSSEVINGFVDNFNESPEYLNWTDKYKATSTKNLIGNFENIKELKKWLLSWREIEQRSNTKAKGSDSSDFYDSDSNSKDSFRNNLLIVTGPVGCGKTSSVYAVAEELAIKVIEVNASSKRTGKVMLQDLQEATQSHKVNRGGLENSQKSQEIVETVTTVVSKKRGRPKKLESLKKVSSKNEVPSGSQPSASQDRIRTGMSLILVDDADIVFDQDDGFSSAIAQLIQCTKRPVILVTGSMTCPHLQRFLQYGKVINMQTCSPRMLGTWLDIMCLAEGVCWQGLGAKILDYFKGDIRKSINNLQFYMSTYSQAGYKDEEASQLSDFKPTPDDENSNMSWPDYEGAEDKKIFETTTDATDIVWKHFMDKVANLLHLKYPKHLFSVWWNVPRLLNYQAEVISVDNVQHKQQTIQELEAVANVMDTLSVSDYYSSSKPDTSCNIISEPWYSSESDSVSEQDCMESYNRCHEVTNDILQEFVASSITEAQKTLQCERNMFIQSPNMAAQREKDRLTSRHENLSSVLNSSAILDRKALALDYWSACRTICRIEKNKTDTVSRRNNRFCHYLKSMNVMCRNDSFDSLSDSLLFKGKID